MYIIRQGTQLRHIIHITYVRDLVIIFRYPMSVVYLGSLSIHRVTRSRYSKIHSIQPLYPATLSSHSIQPLYPAILSSQSIQPLYPATLSSHSIQPLYPGAISGYNIQVLHLAICLLNTRPNDRVVDSSQRRDHHSADFASESPRDELVDMR